MKNLRLKANLIFLSFIALSLAVNAQTVSPGSMKGTPSVSSTGAFTYSIPIVLPPGIKDLVPTLSLDYNSQSGNGLMGMGWSLSGISSIARVPADIYHDGNVHAVNLDGNDVFALDGQRLLHTSGSSYTTAVADFSPLKYTDKDGEWVQYALAGLIGGTLNTINNWGNVTNASSFLTYFGAGALGGIASLASPILGGAIVAALNTAYDYDQGRIPNLSDPVDAVKYVGLKVLDASTVAGSGAMARVGVDLITKWGLKETVTGATKYAYIEGIGYTVADDAVFTSTKVCTSTLVASESAVVAKQGGLSLFKYGEQGAVKNGNRILDFFNKGSAKLNWKQNAGLLRKEMQSGNPIYDSYLKSDGTLETTKGFLNAERNLLRLHGWEFNPNIGAWMPPIH